ncbi:MAG: hypothetical protein CBCREVIR_2112 [Candidatus Burkholderia crenata]|nr:MAG: hypothetical protein CBCREVIR_2112 [Candidatus Burkholderia crenata]
MLWGDAKLGLYDLLAALGERAESMRQRHAGYAAEIPQRMEKWREEVAEKLYSSPSASRAS